MDPAYTTVDEYIALQSPEIQERLTALRAAIREAAPEATEKISWGMPTFVLFGNLIHFAAAKKHIGLYPGESGVAHFKERLEGLGFTKGAIQLPHARPLPLALVKEITAFRAEENRAFAEEKAKQKRRKPGGGF